MKTDTLTKPRTRNHVKPQARGKVVHFEVANPSAQKVAIAGSFNDWQPKLGEMARLGDGKWAKDLALRPGTYEYRLVVDGNWMPDPRADHSVVNPFGERNSLVTVT